MLKEKVKENKMFSLLKAFSFFQKEKFLSKQQKDISAVHWDGAIAENNFTKVIHLVQK